MIWSWLDHVANQLSKQCFLSAIHDDMRKSSAVIFCASLSRANAYTTANMENKENWESTTFTLHSNDNKFISLAWIRILTRPTKDLDLQCRGILCQLLLLSWICPLRTEKIQNPPRFHHATLSCLFCGCSRDVGSSFVRSICCDHRAPGSSVLHYYVCQSLGSIADSSGNKVGQSYSAGLHGRGDGQLCAVDNCWTLGYAWYSYLLSHYSGPGVEWCADRIEAKVWKRWPWYDPIDGRRNGLRRYSRLVQPCILVDLWCIYVLFVRWDNCQNDLYISPAEKNGLYRRHDYLQSSVALYRRCYITKAVLSKSWIFYDLVKCKEVVMNIIMVWNYAHL